MRVETLKHDVEAQRILNELARLIDAVPGVTIERVDEHTLAIESDEPGRDQEIRTLVLERLDAIHLGWQMYVQLDDQKRSAG